jgi:hypothetical protein
MPIGEVVVANGYIAAAVVGMQQFMSVLNLLLFGHGRYPLAALHYLVDTDSEECGYANP